MEGNCLIVLEISEKNRGRVTGKREREREREICRLRKRFTP